MYPRSVLVLLVLIAATSARLFPPAREQVYRNGHLPLHHICLLYQLYTGDDFHVASQYYLNKVQLRLNDRSPCPRLTTYTLGEHTLLELVQVASMPSEGYQLNITETGVRLSFSQYSGYVYGLESLSQLVETEGIRLGVIRDEPQVVHRGILIDSVRHFISVPTISRLIESMPLSKLNVLHWHISDDEAFSLRVQSHPELADSSIYSKNEVYTVDDVRTLIAVAKKNAVQLVPEIDTPAHVRSWGRSPKWQAENITIACPGGQGYNEQFDVSKDSVYQLAKEVIREVDQLFRDSPYIHFGGDQTSARCWDLRPQIKTFMKLKNITNYGELGTYWRYQLKQSLPAGRKVVFWRNSDTDVKLADDDILHYWGAQGDTAKVAAASNGKIILSPTDVLYINLGQGNIWLNSSAGSYSTYRHIYESFVVFPAGVDAARILGAEVCLWSEVSNEDTFENNIWMRASAFGAKVWSPTKLSQVELVRSLTKLSASLESMGVQPSPFTTEYCQKYPQACF